MKIFVTGAAGFIGSHVSSHLCQRGDIVLGVDNINDYYEPSLKYDRLENLGVFENFQFLQLDVADRQAVDHLFNTQDFDFVIHLAAQAGVRYSIENPHAYCNSNLTGFLNILEGCRARSVKHLVYASSSSVYGANKKIPFCETDVVDHPLSFYAATKKANEAMAHSYSHLYSLPTTGLRFFTVYGPWGRPDMSPMLFAKSIVDGSPIKVFNYGNHYRDFTYIDDVVDGVVLALDRVTTPSVAEVISQFEGGMSGTPWRIYNIGNSKPVRLEYFINCLEEEFGREVKKELLPMQLGDVETTYADISALSKDTGYSPKIPIEHGVKLFSEWYMKYYS